MSDTSPHSEESHISYHSLLSLLKGLKFPVYGFEGHPYALHLSGYGGGSSGFALSFRTRGTQEPQRKINVFSAQLNSGDRENMTPGNAYPPSAIAYFGPIELSAIAHYDQVERIPRDTMAAPVLTVEKVIIAGQRFRAIVGREQSKTDTYSTTAFLYSLGRDVRLQIAWSGLTPYQLLSLAETAVEVNGKLDLIQNYTYDLDAWRQEDR